MSWLDGLKHRLRAVLQPSVFRRELDDEMRLHLELDAMQERDTQIALRHFGNRTYYTEETRRMTWLGALDPIRQDLDHAWRSIVRTPGFTFLVVLTLALGLGATAALFSFLDRLYLRPAKGIHDPATLRRIWINYPNSLDGVPFAAGPMSYPRFNAIAKAAGGAASVAAFYMDEAMSLGRGHGAPRLRGVYASANYFTVLDVQPALGRFFVPDEDRLGHGAPVAVVSHTFWKRHLGSDSTAIGKPIMIGRDPRTVIGVTEPDFGGLDLQAADVWLPLSTLPSPTWSKGPWWEAQTMHWFRAVLRVSPALSVTDFERRATQLLQTLNRAETQMARDSLMTVSLGSIIEARGPGRPGQELVISTRLGGVAAIVLLIACANVINLLLARAVSRRREIAVRLALGMSRRRLVRLLSLESVLLASIAAVVAMMVGWWGGTLLRVLLIPDVEWSDSAMHWRVGAFTISVAIIAGCVAGLIPAVQASNPRLTSALKAGSREGGQQRSRLRSSLIVLQAALAVLLLAGAGLFVRSLQHVRGLDIGYDAGQLLFGEVKFDEGQSPPAPVTGAMMRHVASRLEREPSIEAVARAGIRPMWGVSFIEFYSGNDSSGTFGRRAPAVSAVSPSFFRATGIRLLRGEGFSGGDVAAGPAEVVVNEAAAAVLWPGREALGECLRFERARESPCYRVVGVVENARLMRVIEKEVAAQFFLPLGNVPSGDWSGAVIVARTRPRGTAAASAALTSALRRAFPTAEATVTSMSESLEWEYRPWKLGASLFTAFGLLALLVALVGIYSTVSYGVSQRTHEFGVRVALGARVSDVLRHVIGSGVRAVAVGVAIGVALTIAAGRLIASLLYGVEPSDPAVLLLVSVTLVAVAALASLSPAWRAARVDPVTALKTE